MLTHFDDTASARLVEINTGERCSYVGLCIHQKRH